MHFKESIELSFRGSMWTAEFKGKSISSDSLEDMDNQIRSLIREVVNPAGGDIYEVKYHFDNAAIPEWIRQYSNHYFNRTVEFKF